MQLTKIFGITIICLSILFLGFQSLGWELEAFGVKALTLVLLALLYFISVKSKHILFILFLLLFTTAEVYNYFTFNLLPADDAPLDMYYIVGNSFFMLSYVFLIGRVLSLMDIKKALTRFPIQILLLATLGIFVTYMITDLSISSTPLDYAYFIELFYNALIMILVSLSLINYMYKDTKKSMNLLIGCIFIVFSEVIQIAYYYITDYDNTLNVVYSVFLVAAFVFFYLQSRLEDEPERVLSYSEVEA
ncbi:hypothetical protein [Psychroserpens sp.]|uniref:hypothetical protein n=1 Tax=Psychroserpens sp. TaxID=2020870 RepID=UPI001B213B1C|nr:hypothetical protein [Psychroserpens sp.]MBO6606808.1 hypothetical protein [Psychroserpens sp.]MBO6632302.1 hypothetical protein [Psychroserpens sp.]MBO6653511.1 hypothetical protein [Psychroserpens sp.]MBO6680461.1 hypothetical protein [Psychroserpens sp.]MBO6750580.1 hypothetical protein [Psychroserpens sp.]